MSFNLPTHESTPAFNLLTSVFNLPTHAFNLATCTFSVLTREFDFVTCGFELVTRGFELVTRRIELVTRGFELVIRGFELVTRGFEFVTRNSYFFVLHLFIDCSFEQNSMSLYTKFYNGYKKKTFTKFFSVFLEIFPLLKTPFQGGNVHLNSLYFPLHANLFSNY